MAVNINVDKSMFNEAFIAQLENYDKRYNIYYGGAGAGKSVFVVQKLLWKILNKRGTNLLVVRKVAKDNRHSTFSEFKKLISFWGLDRPNKRLFAINKSEMTITCVNGNQIMFAGLDDTSKLKGIVFTKGLLSDIWIEEADQITDEDFDLLDLRLRGKYHVPFNITLSFNPVSALSWIKREFFDMEREDAFILKTTYKDNEWCDDKYKDKLEDLKNKNPVLYDIYALGDWGVLGELVYTNYSVENFTWCISELTETDKQQNYDYVFDAQDIYIGQDWGFNDPSATTVIAFKDDELYILQEVYVTGLDNPELMTEVKRNIIKNANKLQIVADSAEPARIKSWRTNGWRIKGAHKKKDFKTNAIRWIHSKKIHIQYLCVNFAKEIQGYVYEKDKDGNVKEVPVDFRDHLMDSMIYGLERAIRGKAIEFLK